LIDTSKRLIGHRLAFCATLRLVKMVIMGFIRVCLGVVMLPVLPFSTYFGMRAVIHLLRCAGTIAGALGNSHQEHLPVGVTLDRPERPLKKQEW
jgi:hypothetical protein